MSLLSNKSSIQEQHSRAAINFRLVQTYYSTRLWCREAVIESRTTTEKFGSMI